MTKLYTTLGLILSCTLSAMGQNQLQGHVSTRHGEAIESAEVSLKNTSRGTVTDARGYYELEGLTAGRYEVEVSYMGYGKKVRQVTIDDQKTVTLNFELVPVVHTLDEVTIAGDKNRYMTPVVSPALRMKTPILETSQNIQVVTGEELQDQQIFNMLEGVTRNISGAQRLEHWDNYARINMRGSQLTAFRNGMNMQLSPWSPMTEDMSMVERIEFVKGPAGFMLAAGEPGGFYNVVTKKPTGQERGEVNVSLGSFDQYRLTTDLDGVLSKNGKLLYRLNLMGELRGSHRDFETNNRYLISPVLKYLVDDQTTFTLEYDEQFSQMSVIGSNYAFSKRGYADLPRSFTTAEPNLDPSEMRDRTLMAILEHRFSERWQLTAQASYLYFKQIGQSLWPYGIDSENDSLMQRGISIWDALGFNKNAQVFINGEFNTGGISHHLLSGIDMSHRDYYADWNQGAPLGGPFNIYAPQYGQVPASGIPEWDRSQDIRERGVNYNNSYSAFYLQDQLNFLDDRLRLTLAGRFTSNRQINPYSGTRENEKWTPRVGLSWSVIPDMALYAVLDQSFLPNLGVDWQGRSFDPVTGTNLEVGVKRDWDQGRWNSTVSAYRIVKNNVLTTDYEHPSVGNDPDNPQPPQYIYSRTTGEQEVKGVELDLRGEVIQGLQVVINYAYTDAVITEDSNPEVVGNHVAGATKHLQNTWLTYAPAGGRLQGLSFSLGYQFQAGRSSWYVFDSSGNSLPDYFRLDGGVGYKKDRMRFNIMVNNLLDEYLYSGAPSGDMYYWQTEPGRNFRLTIGYSF